MIDYIDLGTVGGFDIRVTIEYDDHLGHPLDEFGSEVYDDDQVEAYVRGDWSYVGLIVTASKRGHVLGSASLWGLEYGMYPNVQETLPGTWLNPLEYGADDILPDLIDEAVEQANAELAELREV